MFFRLTLVVILWSLAIVLWRKNQRNLFSRWMSACMFLNGLEPLSACIQKYFLSSLQSNPDQRIFVETLHALSLFSAYTFVFCLPYTILMGGIAFSELISRGTNFIASCCILVSVFLFSLNYQTYPVLYYDFEWIKVYAAGCFLIGIVLISISLARENDFFIRLNRKRTLIVYSVVGIWLLFVDYLNVKSVYIDMERFKFESVWLDTNKLTNYFNFHRLSFDSCLSFFRRGIRDVRGEAAYRTA